MLLASILSGLLKWSLYCLTTHSDILAKFFRDCESQKSLVSLPLWSNCRPVVSRLWRISWAKVKPNDPTFRYFGTRNEKWVSLTKPKGITIRKQFGYIWIWIDRLFAPWAIKPKFGKLILLWLILLMRNVLFLSYHAPYCDVFLVVVFAEDELRFPRSRPAGSCTQFSEVKTKCKLDNSSIKSITSILSLFLSICTNTTCIY